MSNHVKGFSRKTLALGGTAAVVLLFATVAGAGSGFKNGNFETGDLTGWSTWHAGAGDWFVSNKKITPISGDSWYGPAEKEYAAVTDQDDPGTNILYRTIKIGSKTTRLSFIVYYKNRADVFCTPDTLDYTGACNQQYRIDILDPAAPIDSMAGSDILKNVFRTKTDSPLTLGPTKVSVNLTGLSGKVILRVAEVDNAFFFHAAIDNVQVNNG